MQGRRLSGGDREFGAGREPGNTLDGVADFHAYQNILSYLKANVAINDVKIVSVNGQALTLELDLAAEWKQVWTTLALDKRLLPTEQESIYHWRH